MSSSKCGNELDILGMKDDDMSQFMANSMVKELESRSNSGLNSANQSQSRVLDSKMTSALGNLTIYKDFSNNYEYKHDSARLTQMTPSPILEEAGEMSGGHPINEKTTSRRKKSM